MPIARSVVGIVRVCRKDPAQVQRQRKRVKQKLQLVSQAYVS